MSVFGTEHATAKVMRFEGPSNDSHKIKNAPCIRRAIRLRGSMFTVRRYRPVRYQQHALRLANDSLMDRWMSAMSTRNIAVRYRYTTPALEF